MQCSLPLDESGRASYYRVGNGYSGMSERIYARSEDGGLEPLEEEPFSTEDELQSLIAEHPELLDGEQMRPGDPRRWILISREKGIAETSDEGARWYLDHLLVDQDAVPTLAELKRGSNSQIRRTIVGQMLEYAAHATATWTATDLRRTFEMQATSRGLDPDEVLGQLLQGDGLADADDFWKAVATNLTARRLRLLFVADQIPDSLRRVVEFLNSQMPNIEVLAVEVKQFRGKSSQTLVPRVIGRTAAESNQKPRRKLTREAFLDEFPTTDTRFVADQLLRVAVRCGATLAWGSSGLSIRMRCSVRSEPITVCWMFPPSVVGWMGLTDLSFGEAVCNDSWPSPGSPLRIVLDEWVDQFSHDGFGEDSGKNWARIWKVDYATAAVHIQLLGDRLNEVLDKLKSL